MHSYTCVESASEFNAFCFLAGYIAMSIHQTAWGTQGEQRSFTESSQAVALLYALFLQCFTKQVVELLSPACILVSENTGLLEKKIIKKSQGRLSKAKLFWGSGLNFYSKTISISLNGLLMLPYLRSQFNLLLR